MFLQLQPCLSGHGRRTVRLTTSLATDVPPLALPPPLAHTDLDLTLDPTDRATTPPSGGRTATDPCTCEPIQTMGEVRPNISTSVQDVFHVFCGVIEDDLPLLATNTLPSLLCNTVLPQHVDRWSSFLIAEVGITMSVLRLSHRRLTFVYKLAGPWYKAP